MALHCRLRTPDCGQRLTVTYDHQFINTGLIPKLGNLDSWCPTLCGDDRIVNASRIKCLDGCDKPAATPHIGREQRELVLVNAFCLSGSSWTPLSTAYSHVMSAFEGLRLLIFGWPLPT